MAKTRNATGEARGKVAQAPVAAIPFDTELVHGLFDGPLKAWLHMLRLTEQLQQMQVQALHGTDSPLGPIVAETDGRRGLEDLFGLPVTLAAEQAALTARLSSECLSDLLDVEREWFQQVESASAEIAREWLSRQGWLTNPGTRAALEMPHSLSSIGLFNNTQAALAEIAKIWVDAAEHDVQS
jgi:hypothetical protein